MDSKKICIGWREWLCLPDLNIPKIKAKIDTGARTSAIHAFEIQPFTMDKQDWIRFNIHPLQHSNMRQMCQALIFDERWITDSGGHKEKRYVIKTQMMLKNFCWEIEITLTNRDTMGFRMLLGRTAMKGRLLVDPSRSYLITRYSS